MIYKLYVASLQIEFVLQYLKELFPNLYISIAHSRFSVVLQGGFPELHNPQFTVLIWNSPISYVLSGGL